MNMINHDELVMFSHDDDDDDDYGDDNQSICSWMFRAKGRSLSVAYICLTYLTMLASILYTMVHSAVTVITVWCTRTISTILTQFGLLRTFIYL